jgi:hypothetical protein
MSPIHIDTQFESANGTSFRRLGEDHYAFEAETRGARLLPRYEDGQ